MRLSGQAALARFAAAVAAALGAGDALSAALAAAPPPGALRAAPAPVPGAPGPAGTAPGVKAEAGPGGAGVKREGPGAGAGPAAAPVAASYAAPVVAPPLSPAPSPLAPQLVGVQGAALQQGAAKIAFAVGRRADGEGEGASAPLHPCRALTASLARRWRGPRSTPRSSSATSTDCSLLVSERGAHGCIRQASST